MEIRFLTARFCCSIVNPRCYKCEDFELTAEEMHQIEELDTGKSLFFSHHNPEMVEWFMSFV